MKIGIFIPAYQAASTLDGVLERIPTDLWAALESIHIVDDGCSDGTHLVARRWIERDPRIRLHRHPSNMGYGPSVRDGLLAIKNSSCDFAVCLHADGQYPPELVLPLLHRMTTRHLDLLQGSRHLETGARQGGMPLYKIAAGKALVKLENAIFGMKMTDYHSGFLFYSRAALDRIPFGQLGASFDFDLQVIACARALELGIGEEAIPTRYAGEVSHLNPFAYGLRVLKVLRRYQHGHFHRICGMSPGR